MGEIGAIFTSLPWEPATIIVLLYLVYKLVVLNSKSVPRHVWELTCMRIEAKLDDSGRTLDQIKGRVGL